MVLGVVMVGVNGTLKVLVIPQRVVLEIVMVDGYVIGQVVELSKGFVVPEIVMGHVSSLANVLALI